MRIAYVIEGLYNSAGMERVLAARVNEICKTFETTIITYDDGKKPDFFSLDTRIHRIYLNANISDVRQKLQQVLFRERFDIVTSMGGYDFFFLHSIKDGSKKIIEFHFSFDVSNVWLGHIKNPVWRRLLIAAQKYKRIYHAKKYDKVIVLCKTDKLKWQKFCNKVTYIYNPLTIRCEHPSSCDSKIVIAVGRLDYQKGYDYLLQIWSLVHREHPDWILNIYGDGTLLNTLNEQISNLGLSETVFLRGKTDNIVSKYTESSLFVLTSRDEAFGLVITEAEACGLPIITYDCPSAPAELVNDGENGYVISPVGNIDEFADKVCYLIEHADLRKKMAKKSLDIAECFQINDIIRQWVNLYQTL